MKTIDLQNETKNIAYHLENKAEKGMDKEPIRLLLKDREDYVFLLSKRELENYNIAYNEYEGGLYLGSEAHPYRYLVMAADEDLRYLRIHPDCIFIAPYSFHKHPNLEEIEICSSEELWIDENSFAECPKLRKVSFDCSNSVFLRHQAFAKNPLLEEVAFDDVATYEFSNNDFRDCGKLKKARLPGKLVTNPARNVSTGVFLGTCIDHIFLPASAWSVQKWFEKTTKVYCERDPAEIITDYKEELEYEPYYDYYHPGGTHYVRIDIKGGENFIGPITYQQYLDLI